MSAVLVFLAVLLALLPMIIQKIHREAVWTTTEKKKTIAFQLADAAVDRGYWKLKENPDLVTAIINGHPLPGYDGQTTYTDVAGGEYRISITAGPTFYELTIVGTGKDNSSKEYRAVQAIYDRVGFYGPILGNSVSNTSGGFCVWGSYMSYGDHMTLSGDAGQIYPRIFTKGDLNVGNLTGSLWSDTTSDLPNSWPKPGVLMQWHSFNDFPGVPVVAKPDFDYYRGIAKAQNYYYPGNWSPGSFADPVCTVGADPKVHFVEGNATVAGSSYFCGVLIVMGQLSISGTGRSPEGDLTITPPAEAWREYELNVPVHASINPVDAPTWNYTADPGSHPLTCKPPHGDSDAPDEYPGDAGFHKTDHFNVITGRIPEGQVVGNGQMGGAPPQPLKFKGFGYSKRRMFLSGLNYSIYGVLQSEAEIKITGAVGIFYDDTLKVKFQEDLVKTNWHEVNPTEF